MTTTMRVGNLKKRSLVEAAIHVLWLCHGKFWWWKCLEVCEHRQGWDSTSADSDGDWGPFWSKTKKHATIYNAWRRHACLYDIKSAYRDWKYVRICMNLLKLMIWHNLCLLWTLLRESPIQLDWGSPRKGDRPSVGGKAQGQDCGMVNVRDAFKMGPERWDLCARWNLRGMGIARKKSKNRSITKLVGLHPLVEVAPFSCFERTTCSRILWGSVRCCVLLVFRISVFGKIDDLPCVSTSPLCT